VVCPVARGNPTIATPGHRNVYFSVQTEDMQPAFQIPFTAADLKVG
jgi:hypothetical protein